MAGIYVHIPFCRKACRYCDFHFTVSLSARKDMIKAIGKEISDRQDYLSGEEISTIYFGGGTPSVLDKEDIYYLLEKIYEYNISGNNEITFEANPDDLTVDYIKMLSDCGINRLSIGVQSFFEDDLLLMRRSHNVGQSFQAIENACKIGFRNLNIDLIYGMPGMVIEKWEKNLDMSFDFNIPHISAYHLTFESGTVLYHWLKKGRIKPLEEKESNEQFQTLRAKAISQGYDHYEISNFAREGYISRHNSNYWKQVPYIGFGPSAHSYNLNSRRWNISSNKKYYENLISGKVYYEEEQLSINDMFNEYIMTSLRTKWGVDTDFIQKKFKKSKYEYFIKATGKYIKQGLILQDGSKYLLSEKGMFISDSILSDLFFLEEAAFLKCKF